MKRFHYSAVDRQGQPVTGSVEAADWAAASQLLVDRGLVDCRETQSANAIVLSTADAAELAGYLSELSKTGLPLGGTLQTLAQDASSPALRRAIDDLSANLASGQSLEVAIDGLGARLPEHLRRLLGSSARSGRLSQTLEQLLAHEQQVDDMGRRLRQAVAYPTILLGLLVVWLFVVVTSVLPALLSILSENRDESFVEMNRAPVEFMLFAATQWFPTMLAITLLGLLALVGTVALIGGRAALSRLLGFVPVVGPCWRSRGIADFSGLLAEFIDEQLPLEEALRLTAVGVRDPALQAAALQASRQVAQGTSLAQALHYERVFPHTLQQWCQWGQFHGDLAKALRASSTTFSERFALRLQLVRAILPAVVFALIGISAVMVAAGVFHTLFQFVRVLESWQPEPPRKISGPEFWLPIAVSVILVIGAALLLVARWVRGHDDTTEALATVARYVGAFLIAAALLIGFVALLGPLGFLLWLLAMTAWIVAAARYRYVQKQSLWMTLSLAAECGAPLAPMALAFADEQRGRVALAARQLARQLAAGAALPEALDWSKGALPAEAPMAIRVGTDSGDLLGALRAASGSRRVGRPLMPAAIFWLLLFVPAAFLTVSFTAIKILPAYMTIFDDFEAALPPVTIFMYGLLNQPLLPWLGLALASVPVLIWLQWRGTFQPRLPVLKSIVRWLELGPVLRILALVTRRGEPLPQALGTIARLHPRRWLRRRLQAALGDLDRGLSWQESLRRRRLLSEGDLAVLAAAERNGNLSWALEEMGDSFDRRADFQLKAVSEFAQPLLLTLIGMAVALFVLAYFVPLVNIIRSLS
jgi:type II secretory pathway component PulF